MDAGLKRELEEKVRSGERLTREDGVALYGSDDLAWLGGLAHEARTRENGDVVHFDVNRRLDLTAEEAVKFAGELAEENLTELHLAGAPHPDLPWDSHPRALRELKAALPGVALKAFTATGLHQVETVSGRSASALLDELIDAGLESLTDGAESLDTAAGQDAVGPRTRWEDWARIHRLAHEKGLKTPCALPYGPAEEPHGRVDQVLRLRELQDGTGGFQVFVPLSPQEWTGAAVTPLEALKTVAVSRLLLDNVPHVRVFWATHGVQTAQLALQYGADDLDGPVAEHRPTAEVGGAGESGGAGGVGGVGESGGAGEAGQAGGRGTAPKDRTTPGDPLPREDLIDLIRDAGFRPAEHDGRYGTVRAYDGPDPARRESPQPMRL